jgi:hypothetical protein
MDGQILSMKFATYRKAGRRSGNPVFVKTRFPDFPAIPRRTRDHMAGGISKVNASTVASVN